ncbi:MAG: hypothetical protein ABIH72_00280 [archaeon]
MEDTISRKTFIGQVAVGAAGLWGIFNAIGCSDKEEIALEKKLDNIEFNGFAELNSGEYEAIDFSIPTKGKVMRIDKLGDEIYTKRHGDNGIIIIEGSFYYKIEPDRSFSPNLYHTDKYGKTPENPDNDYWGDTRTGKVTLRIKPKKGDKNDK